jgi:hypothetical protein
MDAFETALVTLLAVTGVFALLAIPLMMRVVPRNRAYGFRTHASLRDDFLWFEANARFGRRLLEASAFSAAAIIVLYYTAISVEFFVYTALCVLTVPALLAALDTALHVRTLRLRRNAPANR